MTESQQPARHMLWSHRIRGALGKEFGCITIVGCTMAITLDLLDLHCLLSPREKVHLGDGVDECACESKGKQL